MSNTNSPVALNVYLYVSLLSSPQGQLLPLFLKSWLCLHVKQMTSRIHIH